MPHVMPHAMPNSIPAIRQAFATRRREAKARHRDIAEQLGISEGELIAAHVGGTPTDAHAGGSPADARAGVAPNDDHSGGSPTDAGAPSDAHAGAAPTNDHAGASPANPQARVAPAATHADAMPADAASPLHAIRLAPRWPELIAGLEPVGEVMALTRNASCVHEKVGVYRQASAQAQVGLVLGGDIDLRIFYTHWAHGFAVTEATEQGPQRSLQFFDATGTAIHKVFLKPQSDVPAYLALVERFTDAQQQAGLTPQTAEPANAEKPDAAIDVAGFRAAWAGLRDTHDFFGVLRRFGVTRTQGLRLADPDYVQQVEVSSAHQVLEAAAHDGVPIMVFVGNRGMIQIHTGPVQRVAVMGPWVNVLDPGFNLHLREDQIASAWGVRKPTVDGVVTSLEIFDAQGEVIAMFFGERKPGKPELCEWRLLIERLKGESVPCEA